MVCYHCIVFAATSTSQLHIATICYHWMCQEARVMLSFNSHAKPIAIFVFHFKFYSAQFVWFVHLSLGWLGACISLNPVFRIWLTSAAVLGRCSTWSAGDWNAWSCVVSSKYSPRITCSGYISDSTTSCIQISQVPVCVTLSLWNEITFSYHLVQRSSKTEKLFFRFSLFRNQKEHPHGTFQNAVAGKIYGKRTRFEFYYYGYWCMWYICCCCCCLLLTWLEICLRLCLPICLGTPLNWTANKISFFPISSNNSRIVNMQQDFRTQIAECR